MVYHIKLEITLLNFNINYVQVHKEVTYFNDIPYIIYPLYQYISEPKNLFGEKREEI